MVLRGKNCFCEPLCNLPLSWRPFLFQWAWLSWCGCGESTLPEHLWLVGQAGNTDPEEERGTWGQVKGFSFFFFQMLIMHIVYWMTVLEYAGAQFWLLVYFKTNVIMFTCQSKIFNGMDQSYKDRQLVPLLIVHLHGKMTWRCRGETGEIEMAFDLKVTSQRPISHFLWSKLDIVDLQMWVPEKSANIESGWQTKGTPFFLSLPSPASRGDDLGKKEACGKLQTKCLSALCMSNKNTSKL